MFISKHKFRKNRNVLANTHFDKVTPAMIKIEINDDELRYLISCGAALLQNIPEKSLPTYCHFTKNQIIELMVRFREIADNNGIDI